MIKIVNFQYFIMSIILLSNTNYIYFALSDIKESKKDHHSFIYKCLVFLLYTMLISILYVFKFIKCDGSLFFLENTTILLLIICTLLVGITVFAFWWVKEHSAIKVSLFDWNILFSAVLSLSYTVELIQNTTFYYIIFLSYSMVSIRFFYNVILLKKIKMNFGLYFLLVSYVLIAFVTLLNASLPFEILFTVVLGLNVLIMYGLFLFYAQYYVEELDETYKSVLAHSANLETINAEIKSMAFKDALTGLPNQVSFLKYLQEKNENLTLMIVNIRNFALFNQILGFNQGNELLKKMSEQLMLFSDGDKAIFRLYNDKFLIASPKLEALEMINYVKRIQDAFVNETVINFKLDIVIGITQLVAPSIEDDIANTVLGALEVANAKAKLTENGLFILPLMQYVSEKAEYNLEYHLRHAIDRKQIEVYYQPQVDSKTKKSALMKPLPDGAMRVSTSLHPFSYL